MSAIETAKLREEAADWLVRRDAGLSKADEQALADWVAASPAHARAWTQALSDWARFDTAGGELFDLMREQALAAGPDRAQLWPVGLIAAALVAGAVIVGGLALRHWPASRAPEIAPQIAQTLTTGAQRSERRLPDGTMATLDRQTTIEIRFDAKARRVRLLGGQAYFDVSAATSRPFSVTASDKTVTDIGTRFAVRQDGAGVVTVTLQDGAVSIGERARTVTMRPGEQYEARSGASGVVRPVDLDRALAWRQGYLEFRGTRLDEAVAEMNRYGGPPITLRSPEAAALPISGRFPVGDTRGFADAVAAIHPLRIDQDETGIALERAR